MADQKLDTESNNRFVQFELWHDCKNGCKFCHNIGSGDINKMDGMKFTYDKLCDQNEMQTFNEVGFIGGEFFDDQLIDPQVRAYFYHTLLAKVVELMHTGKVKKFYITSALMFSNTWYLYEFCKYAEGNRIADRCLLCTSYDACGRFTTPEKLDNWCNNMKFLAEYHPQIKTHVETILTGAFTESVLSDCFDIKRFQEQYNTTIDYISPHIIDHEHVAEHMKSKEAYNKFIPNFFPSRDQFMRFLEKTAVKDHSIQLFKLLSNYIRADVVYTIVKGKYYAIWGRRKTDGIFAGMDKMLGLTYKMGYIDSDRTMESDVEAFKELIES